MVHPRDSSTCSRCSCKSPKRESHSQHPLSCKSKSYRPKTAQTNLTKTHSLTALVRREAQSDKGKLGRTWRQYCCHDSTMGGDSHQSSNVLLEWIPSIVPYSRNAAFVRDGHLSKNVPQVSTSCLNQRLLDYRYLRSITSQSVLFRGILDGSVFFSYEFSSCGRGLSSKTRCAVLIDLGRAPEWNDTQMKVVDVKDLKLLLNATSPGPSWAFLLRKTPHGVLTHPISPGGIYACGIEVVPRF